MARPHRKTPKSRRPVFRILITRTQYRVLDVEADNVQEAEDFAMELASDGDGQGWDDFECSAEFDPDRRELPEPFKNDPDREDRVEKVQETSGFRHELLPLDDDEEE